MAKSRVCNFLKAYLLVIVGIDDARKEKVAIKMISKSLLKQNCGKLGAKLKIEIQVMEKLSHPNIIKLLEVVDTKDNVCLVLEYCPTGEFFDLISK